MPETPEEILNTLSEDELPEAGAVVVSQEIILDRSGMSDDDLQTLFNSIPELSHMPGARECARALVDVNDIENQELLHPDDLEPGDTRYNMKYWDFVQPQLMTVLAMRRNGKNHAEIGAYLGVSGSAIAKYIKSFPEFARVMAIGKENYKALLENTAAVVATGYTKILNYEKIVGGVPVKYQKEFYYPPNAQVLIPALQHYAGWKDKQSVDITSGGRSISDLYEEVSRRAVEERQKELTPPE